ncbi:sterol desaturase family protein [Nitratireductor kimnyeongensis]|uniref:Sterol desaturase family protein n=1 Tax=Nitratireductor kimnyeongensis TaxID=430679 RepID=A0ABW0T7F9_9HYPH|nr:sterol desaturase family protein [Nitratireductor kimnyeongensis]QZZ34316.1 sterol desaturase family protein [Nitratireductor kimnyeongensis]
MTSFLFSEAAIRLFAFIGIFAAMGLYELWSPRLERPEMTGALKSRRWFANLSMVLISSVMLRVVFPAAAVGAALWAEARGLGLFQGILGVHPVLAGMVSFIVLDFAVWLEHVASHKIPVLWRIHRMHHADNGFDVTTGLRFHPLEILLSMVWKAIIVILLGAPVLSVLVFEIVLNGMSMFNHSNVKLSPRLDRALRQLVVTPDMHRVHHSTIRQETDSNYGFNFPFWDRLFDTYIAQPKLGHENMNIGLSAYRGTFTAKLAWMLALPFRALRRDQ